MIDRKTLPIGQVTIEDISPGPQERGVILGMTDSGKTVLGRQLCALADHVIVHDFKGNIRWKYYARFETLESVKGADPIKFPRIIYAPCAAELRDPEKIEEFFAWVYDRKNCTLYVDEAGAVTTRSYIPPGYFDCLTRGREEYIRVLSSSQEPSDIYRPIMSQSEHWYVFRTQMPLQQEKISKTIPLSVRQIQELKTIRVPGRPEEHPFYYYRPSLERPLYIRTLAFTGEEPTGR